MRVGDTVRKRISCSTTSGQSSNTSDEESIYRTGKVVYVHPNGRYYTVAFDLPDGTIKECYRD